MNFLRAIKSWKVLACCLPILITDSYLLTSDLGRCTVNRHTRIGTLDEDLRLYDK